MGFNLTSATLAIQQSVVPMATIRRSPAHLALQRILIERRIAAGLLQDVLADRLGRPQSYVSKLENGERRLAVTELLELAEALGCRAEDIVAELVRVSAAESASGQPGPKPAPRRRLKRS